MLRAGETLRQVAQLYGLDPRALLAANPQLRAVQLQAGLRINIPTSTVMAGTSSRSYDPPRVSSQPIRWLSGLQAPTGGVSTQQPYIEASRTYDAASSSMAPAPHTIHWLEVVKGLSFGSKGPRVETLQRALCRIGYAIPVDGLFRDSTKRAVLHFQQLVGLIPKLDGRSRRQDLRGAVEDLTFGALQTAVAAVTQPTQTLVNIGRDSFRTVEERNAYDAMVVLAYDDPSTLRELLRVTRQPVGVPLRLTAKAVTAFAYAAANVGFPLTDDALAPLASLRSTDRASFNSSQALMDFVLPKLRGSRYADTTQYDTMIADAARRNGVDPAFVKAIMAVESHFNPRARSNFTRRNGSVGHAYGLMQLLPGTAKDMGYPKAISNVGQNIEAGVRYIAFLWRRFDGNLANVAAGYNAGQRRVEQNGGVPQIQETYDYVRRVLAHYAYYKMHPVKGSRGFTRRKIEIRDR
ncbi:MAG: transglycosylase SLT domain-containing protein [Clostridia bacterium]|nr:transglycosylase SLT domain-containing protein [Deltaproteobacteria bacterium]